MATASTSPAPQRRTVVWASVALTMLVAGAVLTRCVATDQTTGDEPDQATDTPTPPGPRPTVPAGVTGPTLERAGLAVGFARDEHGATAAAVAYATAAQRWLYFTDDQIRAAVDEIATPIAAPRMAEEIVRDVSMARDQLDDTSGRIWWLVRPLAHHVEDHDQDTARVSVWVVTILSAAKVAAPQTEFMTVTLDLEWVDGDWRVDGSRNTPGPTPLTGPKDQPWDAEPFDDALAGFTRLDGEPVR